MSRARRTVMLGTTIEAHATAGPPACAREVRTIAKGFMLLLAGIPVYVWLKWRAPRHEGVLVLEHEPARVFREPIGID